MQPNRCIRIPWLILTLVLGAGCSIKKVAINKLGNALASGGTTFTSDEDPELVRAAASATLLAVENGACTGSIARRWRLGKCK